jgi:Phage-related protein, tail component
MSTPFVLPASELPPTVKELMRGRGDDFSLSQKQTGLAFDLLSEGPIEGLVNEAEGIFLNGVPLRDHDTNLALKEIVTTGTIAADALTTLTVPDTVIDDMDSGSVTDRTVQILGAGKALGGVTFTIEANSNRLVASGSFFTSGMAGFDSGSPDMQLGWENQTPVEIPGAGPNGTSLFATITSYDSATVVYLDTKALVGVSGASDVKFGHKSKISSINKVANTITLATAATVAVTDESVIINPPNYFQM